MEDCNVVMSVSADENDVLKLNAGRLELVLAPAVGGAIARLDYEADTGKLAVLRGSEAFPPNILQAASFPLVPYCNRIRNGRFNFRGREVTLVRNLASDPSPLHGEGWLRSWDVVRHENHEAEIRFAFGAGEWPWAYEARQVFRLDRQGLSVDLVCRNLADQPMPCGLGQHPFFPCTKQTRLDAGVDSVWTIDEKVLPVEEVPAAGRYDLRDRRVCGQDLDNGFRGWRGVARIRDPELPFEIILSSPDATFLHIYSPMTGDLFAAEPVTHAPAALGEPEEHWPGLGIKILEPGEEARLRTRLEVVEL
jgi:aldose 1-epimerase